MSRERLVACDVCQTAVTEKLGTSYIHGGVMQIGLPAGWVEVRGTIAAGTKYALKGDEFKVTDKPLPFLAELCPECADKIGCGLKDNPVSLSVALGES